MEVIQLKNKLNASEFIFFCLRISNLDNKFHLWHFLNALFCEELQFFFDSLDVSKNVQDNFLPASIGQSYT